MKLFLIIFSTFILIFVVLVFSKGFSSIIDSALLPTKDQAAVKGEFAPTLSPEEQYVKEETDFITTQMSSMSIEQKVGQMFMWGIPSDHMTDETAQLLDSTFSGGVILMQKNFSNSLIDFVNEMQGSKSAELFIATDQEGGVVKRLVSDPNPGAQVLGAGSPDQTCQATQKTAQLLNLQGVNVNFGIVGDIAWDQRSFISSRTFGNNSDIVSQHVAQAVRCSKEVLSTVKHFPGHGRTNSDSHKTVPVITISEDEWEKTDLVPFKAAINEKVDFVMMGHLIYSAMDKLNPASLSFVHVGRVRKEGFEGVIVTDDMKMLFNSGYEPGATVKKAIGAGNDVILYIRGNSGVKELDLYNAVVEDVKNGKILERRIDESLRRILKAKFKIKKRETGN